jgi:hypothetical protein
LLLSLPPGRSYQVIFMERPLSEVVASQAEMIRRRGTSAGLQVHLNQVNAWVGQNPEIQLCRVQYRQVLRDPKGVSEIVRWFLERALDIESMAQHVDQSLYRHRTRMPSAT